MNENDPYAQYQSLGQMTQEEMIRAMNAAQQNVPLSSNLLGNAGMQAVQTPWTYYQQRVYPKMIAPQSWLNRRSLQQPARATTKLLIAVIGIAVFAAVGVLAGFIER